MADNRYIGVFDSGIGGLTVVKAIVESMPKEDIVYFGDTAHVPYGTRSPRQVTEYVLSTQKLKDEMLKGIQLILSEQFPEKEIES